MRCRERERECVLLLCCVGRRKACLAHIRRTVTSSDGVFSALISRELFEHYSDYVDAHNTTRSFRSIPAVPPANERRHARARKIELSRFVIMHNDDDDADNGRRILCFNGFDEEEASFVGLQGGWDGGWLGCGLDGYDGRILGNIIILDYVFVCAMT